VTLALVVSAIALVVSAIALAYALTARRDARVAAEAIHALASRNAGPRRRPSTTPPEHVERREEDAGPPEGQQERRRHRAPEEAPRARRRDADDPQWQALDPAGAETTTIPAVRPEDVPTTEHPAPPRTYRRPPPPLPRPGQIEHPR